MKCITLPLLAGIASCLLAIQGAPAAIDFARSATLPVAHSAVARQQTSAPGQNSAKRAQARGLSRAIRKARRNDRLDKPTAPVRERVVVRKVSNGGFATAQKAAARDQALRDARAERLYQSSQFSAPIILHAKACKRTGAGGQSIYENC